MDEKEGRDGGLEFHYSRERRLKQASEAVRRLNDPAYRRRPSLFQTLVPNRASAFLLLAIFILSSTVVVTRLLVPPPNIAMLAGNKLVLSAFRYQGGTYLAIKKSRLGEDAYRGPVELTIAEAFSKGALAEGALAEGALSTRTITLGSEKAEEFRLSVDGEHERLEVVVTGGGGTVLLTATAE